ncbi:protein TOO MANY MOUTHS [Punica granatum]|uniref:Disease resistance R13L4/SHOC-2-like LRR domain-containing protein n=2 Tax=Punica granatum TaxID=22663 RepID=A0A218XA79_PUNGR|nr:protein TOO MANY MOUTHS [Punica granatum]OWM81843.1 hypothetical protein CDL15_Pgr007881 [Punica granatum]PKI48489.1 hypothetical protein CRG98_031111 [Punica granatum]
MESLLSLLPFAFICLLFPPGNSFTVIMSDSGGPSALVDAPQNRLSTGNNLIRTDSQEQEAVYDIMRATGNEWATEIPDVCRGRWHGIECMPDKDNVYHIVSLSFGALSDDTAFPTCDPTRSHISYSITKLPHLRTLFFYRCFTSHPQPIPAFLGQLGSSLQTLVLRENGHFGPIPSELGNLTRLRVLDLHKNNLNGSIPISLNRIAGLRSLDLSGNRLDGSIPGFTFPLLTVIDLNQNLLAGPIPDEVGSCRSLIKLDFSRNRLTGVIPDSIGNLTDLILMDLSHNRLLGQIPSSVRNLVALQALILKGNPMGPQMVIPDSGFDGLKSLMILVMSGMNLHGSIPEVLARLESLRVLHLDRNRLNGPIPTAFKNLKNLSELRLNDNLLTGPIPFGREVLWRMKRKLRLYNNSGLCFDSSNGLEDDWTDSYGPSIGLCKSMGSGPATTVQRVSESYGDVGPGKEYLPSSSTTTIAKRLFSLGLIQFSAFLLLNSVLL